MLGHEVKCLTCIIMQIMYFTEQKTVNEKLFLLFRYNYLKLGYPYGSPGPERFNRVYKIMSQVSKSTFKKPIVPELLQCFL